MVGASLAKAYQERKAPKEKLLPLGRTWPVHDRNLQGIHLEASSAFRYLPLSYVGLDQC